MDQDTLRFQAWQLDALGAHPAGTDLLAIGPFRAVVSTTPGSGGWVTIVGGTTSRPEITHAVSRLRSMFEQRQTQLEIEYNERLFPEVGRWLEAAGLRLAERNPLMACRPAGLKPFAATGVGLHRLAATSSAGDLQAFQTIRWTNGGDNEERPPPVEQLRKDLAAARSVYMLALLDGEAAGTGVSHALHGAVEIVGVVTRASMRRRGVAATVTSDLVGMHFDSGGDFAFLDAANEEAASVYQRLGFTRFGANLVYR